MALSECNVQTTESQRELTQHGSSLFPIACYDDDLRQNPVPWHWHEEFEALYIIEGTALIGVGSQKYQLKKGQGMFINSQALHEGHPADLQNCRLHSLVFLPRLVGGTPESIIWQKYLFPILQNTSVLAIHLDISAPWHLKTLQALRSAWETTKAEQTGYEIQVRNELSNFILEISCHLPAAACALSDKVIRDTQRIKVMLDYIHHHYMEEINTSLLAKRVMVSESECLRCFKHIIGMPPIQYVKQYRIQKAVELLSTTNQKVIDIGFACGFQDTSYFIKTFRTAKGCTPADYRNTLR